MKDKKKVGREEKVRPESEKKNSVFFHFYLMSE